MKRKDVLIIAIALVIITFGTVFAIYYAINGDNIFSKVKEEITEIAETKKEYHKNGWETAIVEEIKYDVPIPVGFTYVEGKKETGIIIKNNATEEKYMWIPYEETNAIDYEEAIKLGLETSTLEEKENIQKYSGFYVAIDDRSAEEKFEEYIKENAESFDQYYELKKLGYEEYKKIYKETTGEEFDINKIYEISNENNNSRRETVETHTMTIEELSNIKAFNEQIGNIIDVKNMKTMTVLGKLYVDTDEEDLQELIEEYQDKITEVIEYISEEEGISKTKAKNKIYKLNEEAYDELMDIDIDDFDDIEEAEETVENAWEDIVDSILDEYEDEEIYDDLSEILEEHNVTDDEDEEEYPRSINGTKAMLADYIERIEKAIEYIEDNTEYSEEEIEEELGDSYNELVDFEVTRIPAHYEKVQELFLEVKDILIDEFELSKSEQQKVEDILNEKEEEIEIDEKVFEKVKDKNGNEVCVPKGFTHVEGTTVETGFKIINTDNLAFVWIPVEDIDKVKENFIEKAKEANLSDSIIEAYETYEDDETSEEYKEVIKSIKAYGGFYISEAELGYDENGNVINRFRSMIEKWGEGTGFNYVGNGDYYRNVDSGNYYDASTELGKKQREYKLTYESAKETCEELYSDSETVVSHLTYGIEYDAVVNYLLSTGVLDVNKAFKDSTMIGKYKETKENKSIWAKEFYLNGIYGLAGNLEEITAEKDGDNIILRGGSWYTEGSSKPLASKVSISENKMDKGQDENGNEKTLGSVGFRACLYIKTEYEENTELETKKENAVESLKTYINNTSVKSGEVNYFNNAKKEGTDEYQVEAFNQIIDYVEKRLENETSSTGFGKIVQYGKDQVDNQRDNIASILSYPQDVKDYTYGETSGDCWNIKVQAVEDMKTLTWDNGVIKNSEGKVTTYQDIRQKAETDIENKRNEYKEAKIKEYIDNYPTAADKAYTATIKERAKEELKYTNDLANLSTIAVKYQGIIEVANAFENTEPNSWDYYESWKTEYGNLKDEYLNKIAKEAKTKEEAENLAKEGMQKINEKSAEIIKQKKAEEEAAKKTPAPTQAPTTAPTSKPTSTPPSGTKEIGTISLNVGDSKTGKISGGTVSSAWKSENDSIAKVEKKDDRYYLTGVKEGTTKIHVGTTGGYYTVTVGGDAEIVKVEGWLKNKGISATVWKDNNKNLYIKYSGKDYLRITTNGSSNGDIFISCDVLGNGEYATAKQNAAKQLNKNGAISRLPYYDECTAMRNLADKKGAKVSRNSGNIEWINSGNLDQSQAAYRYAFKWKDGSKDTGRGMKQKTDYRIVIDLTP